MKYYRMSYDEVVHKRSYINIMLLNASIPGSKRLKDAKGGDSEAVQVEGKKVHANDFFI
nr:MAG TPA: hypothetical protein [Caudoviricetes sp.]